MPELPEVEITRRSIEPVLKGHTLRKVWVSDKNLRWPLGCEPHQLEGQQVHELQRRGKYILLRLDHGWLMVHLGMSGRLVTRAQLPEPGIHDHFECVTDHGGVRLHDPRRFGAVIHADNLYEGLAKKLLQGLGVEPFSEDFTVAHLAEGLSRRTAPIKQVLLAGEVVVGVGNIYASESLFLAGIHPKRKANSLSIKRVEKLHSAIVRVLTRALEIGGSTLKDFYSPDGEHGYFQLEARVYDQAGQPCTTCGTAIKRIVQGQRATYYCSTCQR